MVAYHLGWRDTDLAELAVPAPSGKKLRPAIALLVSEAVCGSIEPARAAAVALELVHNFSLVHDDIQDRSHLRRHRPTLWSLWGTAQGINAGDALFALAQLALARPSPAPVFWARWPRGRPKTTRKSSRAMGCPWVGRARSRPIPVACGARH